MGHVWLHVLPKQNGPQDGRLLLQEALMRRRLEKYPADFLAHFNLGAALQALDRDAEAVGYLGRAVRLSPTSAAARNTFAVSLMGTDRHPEAISQLREALRVNPSYTNTRYNLARALTATGEIKQAISEYEGFLKQYPEDTQAHALVGGLYASQKQLTTVGPIFILERGLRSLKLCCRIECFAMIAANAFRM